MSTRGGEIVRVLRASSAPSPRLLEVLGALGMGVEHAPERASAALSALVRAALTPGSVAFLTGPSGSGKSTLLRSLHARLIGGGVRCEVVDHRAHVPRVGSLLDALGRDAHHGAACLCAAGLADATLWVRSPSELSDGERARFLIARAWAELEGERTSPHATHALMPRAPMPLLTATASIDPPRALLIDECASTLDRTTARSVCTSLARLARRHRLSLICATAHDDIAQWLLPDMTVQCNPGVKARVFSPKGWAFVAGGGGGSATTPPERDQRSPRTPKGFS